MKTLFEGHDFYKTEWGFSWPMMRVSCFIMRNYRISLHSQEFYEINMVVSGEGIHYFGNNSFTVKKGDVFIIPPMVLHGYDGGAGFDVCHILLHPAFVEKNFAELSELSSFSALFHIVPLMREKTASKLHLSLTEQELDMLMPRLELLMRYEPYADEKEIVRNSEAKTVLAILCGIYRKRVAETESGEDNEFVASIAYIYEHYNENISIDTLVGIALTSRTSYLVKFKKITGTTPHRFQNAYRIEVAKRMLSETEQGISGIAASVGFFDTSHFIKTFVAHEGLTPLEYRREREKTRK